MTADATGGRGDLLEYATAVATAEDTETVFAELARAAERAFDFSSRVAAVNDSGQLAVRSWSGESPETTCIRPTRGSPVTPTRRARLSTSRTPWTTPGSRARHRPGTGRS